MNKNKKTRGIIHFMLHCFYKIYIMFTYIFLSIEKKAGYIINNVSDNIIGTKRRETCSKS